MIFDRRSELTEIKKLDLSVIASAHGYEIQKKKSTKRSVLMSNGSDKIVISRKGSIFVFFSVYDANKSGTAIDFAQKVIEPGCDMGRVRQLLRPFLNAGYMSNIRQEYKGRYAAEIKANSTDYKAVARRYSRFVPIDKPHPYLCSVRGIPFELLQSPRLYDRVRCCPRLGSVTFPHWGWPEGQENKKPCLVGYEIKGPGVNLFSKGGTKGLFISVGMKGDDRLAFTESGLDALSYMAVHGEQGLRVASLSGMMNAGRQPALVRAAIERMGEGSHIIAAFDNDAAGDKLCAQLEAIVKEVNRNSLIFQEDRPARGQDWNHVLQDERGIHRSASLQFGR